MSDGQIGGQFNVSCIVMLWILPLKKGEWFLLRWPLQ